MLPWPANILKLQIGSLLNANTNHEVALYRRFLFQSDFENNGFSLYPNPAKGYFVVKSAEANLATKIALFDITGKLLFSKELTPNTENVIDTNLLAKGTYFVSVETTNGTNYDTRVIVE